MPSNSVTANGTTDTETTTTGNGTAEIDTAATSTDTTATDATTADTTATEKADAQTTATTGETSSTDAGAAIPSAATASSGSFVTGALALVSTGLGLASLTGTSLGDMMRARQELLGQIAAATGGGQTDQIEALYGAPWGTVALVNGTIALLAVVVGAVLLGTRGRVAGTPDWVKAVALGGTVLGVIGLLVSGGMYFDLFASTPTLPPMPGLGG